MNDGRASRMTNKDFAMLSRLEYFQRLAKDIRETKRNGRIAVATMTFSPEQSGVDAVAEALPSAAARGVHTMLIMDAFDFLINGETKIPGPLWFRTGLAERMREPFRSRYAALQKLASAGGKYVITNQPGRSFTLPFAGRSHIKAAVVNNIVYVGCCNLNSPNEIDMMLRWRDARTADWLYELLQSIAKDSNVSRSLHDQDQQYTVDDKTELLVDAGVVRQSIIFDHALALIDSAQEWIVLTSQYFAPGRGTQALARALKRGVKITYYYSHPSMHGPIEGTLHRVAQWRERQRLPAALFERRLARGIHLHAKLLANEKSILIGSHNYGDLGVQLGTAEIALQRTNDMAFTQRAITLIEQQLPPQSPA